jgi:hypothetical protein
LPNDKSTAPLMSGHIQRSFYSIATSSRAVDDAVPVLYRRHPVTREVAQPGTSHYMCFISSKLNFLSSLSYGLPSTSTYGYTK